MGLNGTSQSNGSGELRVTESQPHYLSGIKTTSIPQSLVFLDCESRVVGQTATGDSLQAFRYGVAIAVRRERGKWLRRDVLRFDDPLDFWLWLHGKVEPKRPIWLFAHNLSVDAIWVGTFDRLDANHLLISRPCPNCGSFVKTKCEKHTPFRGAAVMTDPPVILTMWSNRGVIKMVDTMNYWKTSVAKLGDSLSLPKLMMPPDDYGPTDWYEYCERDCEIVEKSVCGLIDQWEKNDCGHWAATAAGLAWSAFRRISKEKTIVIDHGEPHTSMERAAYYGGQSEAYYIGRVRKPVVMVDVRSLYPSVMASQWFPIAYMKTEENPDIEYVKRRLGYHCAIASVTVRTEGSGYPKRMIPDKSIKGGGCAVRLSGRVDWRKEKLLFPVGEYSTFLAGPELQRALDLGEVVRIGAISWYRSGQPFKEFVERWYALRPTYVTPETFAQDLLAKTILNSLSGYFAKHKMRWIDNPDVYPLHRWGQWLSVRADTREIMQYRAIAGHVQQLTEGGESKDSMCAISAYITSYGRECMRACREFAPPGTVYYQDTDSLIIDESAYVELYNRNLLGIGELGKLQLVGRYDECIINWVKDYSLDGREVISGVKKNATKVGNGLYKQEAWESLANSLSRSPDGTVRTREVTVNLDRSQSSRSAETTGWTRPPRLHGENEIPF